MGNLPEGNLPPRPRSAPKPPPVSKRSIKMFTVELSAQGECSIPMGWTPFAVHTLPGTTGVPRALIWCHK
jgi:hypothetical protein